MSLLLHQLHYFLLYVPCNSCIMLTVNASPIFENWPELGTQISSVGIVTSGSLYLFHSVNMLAGTAFNLHKPLLAAVIATLCVQTAFTRVTPAEQWELSNHNRSITLHVRTPGYPLQHLQEHNLIENVLYRYTSLKCIGLCHYWSLK